MQEIQQTDAAEIRQSATGRREINRFTLNIDPSILSTAQQRIIAFKVKRVITNPRVARSMRLIQTCMIGRAAEIRKWIDERLNATPWAGVALKVVYLFPFPKGGTKAERAARREGMPVISGRWGDLDNRQKGLQDALVRSHAMPDDHFISELILKKRYTLGRPRIECGIAIDYGDDFGP